MKISKKNIENLVDDVVLPFEKFIVENEKLAPYLSDVEVAKIHNMAVAKMTIYIYSDINSAYNYIQEGAKAHKDEKIDISYLKEFYSLYFRLCHDWNEKNFEKDDRFGNNLETIEQFVFEAFAKEGETKEEFFIFDSDVVNQNIEKMHYTETQKMTAKELANEGIIDQSDIGDVIESGEGISQIISDQVEDCNAEYFLTLSERIKAYGTVLEKNFEFKDLGFSLMKLSTFLEENHISLDEHDNKKALITILHTIAEDLLSWTNAVLVEQTAIDIHYLDASLLSSVIQFELLFKPAENEEDDLEFF